MATWRVQKSYSPRTAYQRVSLENSDIPGRKAKQYRVSFYKFQDSPAPQIRANSDGSRQSGEVSYLGLDTGRLPESEDVVWAPGPLFGELKDAAVSKVHSRAQKARDTGLNAAVFIAELPSTMKMFVQTARRVTGAWKAVKRGNLAVARKLLNVSKGGKPGSTFANNWLELKYGWLPLLSDIDAGVRKLANVLHDPRTSWDVTGSASRIVEEAHPLNSVAGGVFNFPPGKLYTTTQTIVKVGVSFSISNEMLAHAASLGFTNPMLIAWEAMPLSFVWDWIIPIGEWLSQFSTFHGMRFVDGYVTVKGKTNQTYLYPGGSYTAYMGRSYYDENGVLQTRIVPDYVMTQGASAIVTETSGFRRDPMSDFPGPVAPRLDIRFSIHKFVTALSLARQRL